MTPRLLLLILTSLQIFPLTGCAYLQSYGQEKPSVPLLAPDGEVIGSREINLTGKGKVLFCQHRTDGSDWCMVLRGGWAFWYEAR